MTAASAPPAADPEKAALRGRALAARAALPQEVRSAASRAIATLGAEIVAREKPARVSLFIPIKGEIGTGPLAVKLAELGVPLCLPVIVAKATPLVFREWRPGDVLEDRPFGLKEPPDSAAEVVPDLLFTPLAAFDAVGRRLGYGGGFYDRTLARLRAVGPVFSVGLAFAAQEVPEVPVRDYDQPIDGILTENGYRPVAMEPK